MGNTCQENKVKKDRKASLQQPRNQNYSNFQNPSYYAQQPLSYGQMNNSQPPNFIPSQENLQNPTFFATNMQYKPNPRHASLPNVQIPSINAQKSQFGLSNTEDEKTRTERMLENFKQFALKFNFPNNFSAKLRTLGNFKIVFLCDDSGSMSLDAYSKEFIKDPFGPVQTRFQELSNMVKCVMDIICVISKDPIDLYFLNRAGKNNANCFEEIAPLFIPDPEGGTPIVRALKAIINDKKLLMAEKNLLIFIATDGMPTDDNGDRNFPELAEYLSNSLHQFPSLYVTFMACVSDEELLRNMDKLGREHDRVGVIDEYHVEFKEMMEKHNNNPEFNFTQGDYLTKALLVAVDKDIKLLFKDEESEDDDVKKAEESDVVKKFKLK